MEKFLPKYRSTPNNSFSKEFQSPTGLFSYTTDEQESYKPKKIRFHKVVEDETTDNSVSSPPSSSPFYKCQTGLFSYTHDSSSKSSASYTSHDKIDEDVLSSCSTDLPKSSTDQPSEDSSSTISSRTNSEQRIFFKKLGNSDVSHSVWNADDETTLRFFKSSGSSNRKDDIIQHDAETSQLRRASSFSTGVSSSRVFTRSKCNVNSQTSKKFNTSTSQNHFEPVFSSTLNNNENTATLSPNTSIQLDVKNKQFRKRSAKSFESLDLSLSIPRKSKSKSRSSIDGISNVSVPDKYENNSTIALTLPRSQKNALLQVEKEYCVFYSPSLCSPMKNVYPPVERIRDTAVVEDVYACYDLEYPQFYKNDTRRKRMLDTHIELEIPERIVVDSEYREELSNIKTSPEVKFDKTKVLNTYSKRNGFKICEDDNDRSYEDKASVLFDQLLEEMGKEEEQEKQDTLRLKKLSTTESPEVKMKKPRVVKIEKVSFNIISRKKREV